MPLDPPFRLATWLALAASACSMRESAIEPGDGNEGPPGQGSVARSWGRLANAGYEGKPIVATLFFAGQARDGSTQYEYPTTSNVELYTEWPSDERAMRWSSEPAARSMALDQMVSTGVNLVLLSNWGPRGSDAWSKYAPMQTSTYAHDEVLWAIANRRLLVAPFLESNPEWTFREDFPGTDADPAPGLVQRIVDLVNRHLLYPAHPAWPGRWAQIYGPDGEARRAIAVIHASSEAAITDQAYVDGLDAVANKVESVTGVKVGFLLDALPPGTYAPGTFFPASSRTAEPMTRSASVLAISCFLPEIWTQIENDPGDVKRLAWKRNFITGWARTEVPTLIDVAPGYDASIVFPGSARYGHSATWRDELLEMVSELGEGGVVFNSWNGYTEAMSMVPTMERGNAVYVWAADLAAAVAP